jgi:rod shape determining protein RodA
LVAGQAGGLFWNALQDYQKLRIVGFLQPNADPLGTGYHLIQSQIAIGSGQLWGRGWLRGTQTQLNFIPEQHTDFIFSAIGEEWGFVGGVLVLLAFVVLAWRLLTVASRCRDNFGSLLAVGVLAWVLFQGAVNVAMTVGFAPITGIPLPWLSHGRSALLTNFLAIGVVQSVALHQRDLKF